MDLAFFGQSLSLFTWPLPSLERFCFYLDGSRFLWRDFVAMYVALAFFGKILSLCTGFSASFEKFCGYLCESRPPWSDFVVILWFSSSLERFSCYLKRFGVLWKDFVAVHVVLAFFGEILSLFGRMQRGTHSVVIEIGSRAPQIRTLIRDTTTIRGLKEGLYRNCFLYWVFDMWQTPTVVIEIRRYALQFHRSKCAIVPQFNILKRVTITISYVGFWTDLGDCSGKHLPLLSKLEAVDS